MAEAQCVSLGAEAFNLFQAGCALTVNIRIFVVHHVR